MASEHSPPGWSEFEMRVRTLLVEGTPDAAAELTIDRLGPSIHSYLRTMLHDDDALDALSEFRVAVWQALPRFRWECSLRSWAYRLANHAAARIWRRPHRRREEPLPSSAASRLPGPGGSSVASSGRHAGLAFLRAQLPLEDQQLLTLRVDRELEWEEVAVALASDDGADPAPGRGGSDGHRASSAALRKRYERLTRRLEQMAREQGLLDADPDRP
jgi:RNA polymerase sigma-70 factor, ECF subfamily